MKTGRSGSCGIEQSAGGKEAKRILITGATGFIGSHVVRRLVREGHRVGIVKRPRSDLRRVQDVLGQVAVHDADLRSSVEVHEAVKVFKPESILHFATYYAVEHEPGEAEAILATNLIGTANLLEAARASDLTLFVNTSTFFVYGNTGKDAREEDELVPFNLYALSKIQAEDMCSFYADRYGLNAVTCRLFPPYGPSDHERKFIPHVIRSFLRNQPLQLTSGRQQWDFTHVDDIVEAYVRVLTASHLPGKHEIFNIGAGRAVSLRDVVLRIKELTGSDVDPEWGAVPHRPNELWYMCADTAKARRLLGWESHVDVLGDGLLSTVAWHQVQLEREGSGPP